ncbi:MAG: hypothetical protein ACRC5A_04870 [Enterobacteriaceae bacterium]
MAKEHLLCLLKKLPAIISISCDGSEPHTVLALEGGTPDGIQFDSQRQIIYWTNMGTNYDQADGTIESIRLDGSDRKLLVGNGAITTPKQLYLDQRDDRLYWCDREGGKVMCCRTDGTQLTVLIDLTIGNTVPCSIFDQCVGITIDPITQTLYWTQKGPSKGNRGRIFRAGLALPAGETAATRTDIELLLDNLPEPIDLDIDVQQRVLYWTDRGAPPDGNSFNCARITSAGLQQHQVICRGFAEAIGLALDLSGKRAFIADLAGQVWCIDLTTAHAQVIYQQDAITGIVLY